MKIQLKDTKIKKIDFSFLGESQEIEDKSFKLDVGQFYSEEKNNEFGVFFHLSLVNLNFKLDVEAVFLFSLSCEITKEFKDSDFPKVNAPAIAFPYLRSFISNLTLQAGLSPIILPSINFVELAKNQEDKR